MRDLFTPDLFIQEMKLKIDKILPSDVSESSDKLEAFKSLIDKHETMYPGIERWLNSKVLSGLKTEERVAYIGYNNEEPIVSAVVKKGKFSKFCHLYIDDKFQDHRIGEIFFAMMALDVRRHAKEVYFTLPEHLWYEKKEFFKSFGFNEAQKSKTQYRNFEEEFICSTQFSTVWKNILEKLPKIITSLSPTSDNLLDGILMSIKPQFLEKIKSGEKVIELRKKFNPKWAGCRVTLYSSNPTKSLYGRAVIQNIKKDNPKKIWDDYEHDIGCTKEQFDSYAGECDQLYAISLINYEDYLTPLPLPQLSYLLDKEDLRPPQSYSSLRENEFWTQAVSIAELLHGRFQIYKPTF